MMMMMMMSIYTEPKKNLCKMARKKVNVLSSEVGILEKMLIIAV